MVWACRTLVIVALFLSASSVLSTYPHQIAYFNEAAGGSYNGYMHLLHSNLDHGQDLCWLSDKLRSSGVPIQEVFIADGRLSDVAKVLGLSVMPEVVPDRWYIVSATQFLGSSRLHQEDLRVLRAGRGLWLFCVLPDDSSHGQYRASRRAESSEARVGSFLRQAFPAWSGFASISE